MTAISPLGRPGSQCIANRILRQHLYKSGTCFYRVCVDGIIVGYDISRQGLLMGNLFSCCTALVLVHITTSG